MVATGPFPSFGPIHRHGQELADHMVFTSENFSYVPPGSRLARPEPPVDSIPIPVFRSAAPVEEDEPESVETPIILQVLVEILREVRSLQAREASQNALAVPWKSAMAMLGCKRSQVFKLLQQRRLERAPKVGRTVMITMASIETLLTAGVPPKGNTRSQKPQQGHESIHMKARACKDRRKTGEATQDPGIAIRKIAIF